jgi:multiple sugar transport system ATP-binding protein
LLPGEDKVARIRLENLVKQFGAHVTAVAGVNLDIQDGEFMIFVGPSGCGKTTTLNMISGLEQPTSGRVIIEQVVNDVEPGERGLGMVFQNLALFPHMSVFENIAFGLRVKRPDRCVSASCRQPRRLGATCSPEAGAVLRWRGAAMGWRTTITNPQVLLLDEPLSSLDAKLRVGMRTELKRLHAQLCSTMSTSRTTGRAMTVADVSTSYVLVISSSSARRSISTVVPPTCLSPPFSACQP